MGVYVPHVFLNIFCQRVKGEIVSISESPKARGTADACQAFCQFWSICIKPHHPPIGFESNPDIRNVWDAIQRCPVYVQQFMDPCNTLVSVIITKISILERKILAFVSPLLDLAVQCWQAEIFWTESYRWPPVLGVFLYRIRNNARVYVAGAHLLEVVTSDTQLSSEPTFPTWLDCGELFEDSLKIALFLLIERGWAQKLN